MNIFEKATKGKFRFNSTKGLLTTEDVWDLPLTSKRRPSLESLWTELNDEVKKTSIEGCPLIITKSSGVRQAEAKLAIVTSIIEERQAMAERRKNVAITKEKEEQLLRLIYDKENDELRGKSKEELLIELAKIRASGTATDHV